jgi:transcriptional regulator with XRE-family HTH domain
MPRQQSTSQNLPHKEYFCRQAGLSQQQLADLAHVRQETISRIESAKHTVTPRVL